MENMFLCTPDFLSTKMNIGGIIQTGITHLIMLESENIDKSLIDKFEILKLQNINNSFK